MERRCEDISTKTDNETIGMVNKSLLYNQLKIIAIPITIQLLFQSLMGYIDQIMISYLGDNYIEALGLFGQVTSLYCTIIVAVASGASISFAKAIGGNNKEYLKTGLYSNVVINVFISILFIVGLIVKSKFIFGLYTENAGVINLTYIYSDIVKWSYLPMAINQIVCSLLRNVKCANKILYSGVSSLLLNVILNFIVILLGDNKVIITGLALATLISRIMELIINLIFITRFKIIDLGKNVILYLKFKDVLAINLPIVINELLWGVGDSIIVIIYSGTSENALVLLALLAPIQTISFGLLNGVAIASGICVGQFGKNIKQEKYAIAKWFVKITILVTSIVIMAVIMLEKYIISLYNISEYLNNDLKKLIHIMLFFFPAKVLNMVIGGNIIRSDGITFPTLLIDFLGTWIFGIPIALLSAYIFSGNFLYVYICVSLGEIVKVLLFCTILRKNTWINCIE